SRSSTRCSCCRGTSATRRSTSTASRTRSPPRSRPWRGPRHDDGRQMSGTERVDLRIGLVGAGGIAQSYVRVFEGIEGARITAVADVRARAAEAIADTVRGTAFPSHRALLDEAEVDAVLVCTPPSTHSEIVLQAIERGRHVMCEKPLAIDVTSARAMVDAAEAAGVVFTMAAKFRFVEDVIQARQIAASGILGELIVLENLFASRIDMSRRWNSDPEVSGGGVLIDN